MKMKFAIVLIALVVAASAFPAREKEFMEWRAKYGKFYPSENEHNLRMKIFSANLAYIENYNSHAQTEEDVRLDLNAFADLTNAEFRAMYLGTRVQTNAASPVHSMVGARVDRIDYRLKGVVNEVKNQGSCGSCWAFSAVGALESGYALKTGELVRLSEQQLVDCDTTVNEGCNGGLMDKAMEYAIKYGMMKEEDYKYTAKDGVCKYNATKATYHFTGYENVRNEEQLQDALAHVGPVAVAIDAGQMSFQFYRSGIYNEKKCKTRNEELNHGVVAVGYDFLGEDPTNVDQQYYIVRNSWGSGWGQKGYVWMSRNKGNQCGIATDAEYPIL